MIARALVLAALAGCSSILGIEDLGGPGTTGPDGGAPADIMIGERIDLTGTGTLFDAQGQGVSLANAQLDFVSKGGAALSTQTTASGSYTFAIPTMNQPVDGVVVIHRDAVGTYPRTHNVPPVLTSNRTYSLVTFSGTFIQMMSQIAGEPHDPNATFVLFQLTNSANAGVAGIKIECEVGNRVIYGDASGFPNQSEVKSSSSGLAYIFNAQPVLGTCLATSAQNIVGQRTIDGGVDDLQPGMIMVSLEVLGE